MKRVLLIMLAICTLASCSEDKGDDTPKNIEIKGGKTTQEVFADNTQGSEGVKFTTTGAWTSSIVATTKAYAGTPDWVSIDPASGDKAGDYTINIILAPNYTGENRKAEIKISCGDTVITITIEQKGTTEDNEKPKPGLAQVSKTTYKSKLDDDNGTNPDVTLYSYNSSGKITKIVEQYYIVDEIGTDGTPGKVTSHEMTCNITYENSGVQFNITSTEEDQSFTGTAKLNAKGYIESANAGGLTYEMSYDPKWQIQEVTERDQDGPRQNRCQWSDGNFTTLIWGNLGEEIAKYSTYPNDKINLDINWLFLQNLEAFAFLDGSHSMNSLYAIQNMLGVRSKNYVLEFWTNYNSESWKGKKHKLEYEFNNEQQPIKIKEYTWDSQAEKYNYSGAMTIEYNK